MVKSHLSILFLLGMVSFIVAQDDETLSKLLNDDVQVDEASEVLVVTASRYVEPINTAAASCEVLDRETLFERQSRTLPESLERTTGIMVQKTGNGQGSPYIRGFTGFGTLLLVDGIRLNNATFRSGPNQYWNTVDSYSIDRIEIFKGSGSALYGSDAIGGTVQAFTLMPEYAQSESDETGGRVFTRLSSAEDSISSRIEGEYRSQRYAFLIGATYKHFGDLKAADIGRQKKTGYDEYNYDIKARFKMRGDRELIFAHYTTILNDAWRTHKTKYSTAEWEGTSAGTEEKFSFDQERELTYLSYRDNEANRAFDSLNVTLYYQQQDEIQTRQKKVTSTLYHNETNVDTFGLNLDMVKESDWGTWAYGATYSVDQVDSHVDDPKNFLYGIQGASPNDSYYHIAALYLQDRIYLTERLDLTIGTRATYTKADIGSYYNPNTMAKDEQSDDWTSLCSNIRLGYHFLDDKALIYASVAQGYRTPNLSDMARYDDFGTSSKEVPASGLDPELYLTGEVGLRYTDDVIAWHMAYFYTDIDDQIIRTLDHVDSGGTSIMTKVNGGSGYVHGFECEFAWQLHRQLLWSSGVTLISGMTDYYDEKNQVDIHEPIRTMPYTIYSALRWESLDKRYWAEIVEVASDKEDRLTASDKIDQQRIPPGGTPAYATTDLRIGWNVSEKCSTVLALENCFDEDYRIHGSGSNEAGRNLVWSFEYRF